MGGANVRFEKGARRQHADRDAALHIEDARSVEPALGIHERHALELSRGPDGVEMSEQQQLTGAAPEFGEQMVAAIGACQPRHAPANRFEPRRQLGPAAIDRSLVSCRRLEADQRLDCVEQPVPFGPAEIEEMVYSGHVVWWRSTIDFTEQDW